MTRRNLLAIAPALALSSCANRRSPLYQGYALIANHAGRSIAVVDLTLFRVLKEIPLPVAPNFVVSFPRRSVSYVLSAGSTFAEVIDLDSMNLNGRVQLSAKPVAVRSSSQEDALWIAAREPDLLIRFDLARKDITRVRLSFPPAALDVDGSQVLLASSAANRAAHYALASQTLTISPPLGASPSLICLRPDGRVALAGNGPARTMTVFDLPNMRPMVDLVLPLAPEHLCFNSDGGQLFVTGKGMDAVAIVSPYQTEVGETVLAGSQPGGMAATSAGPQYLFVANQSGDVTVINIDTRHPVAQIPVGQKPNTVLLTPDNEYALVLNEESGDVAVIRLLSIRQANLNSRRSRTAPLFTMIPVGGEPVGGSIVPRLA